MGEEIKISVKVQKGREVRKFSLRRYLPGQITFSRFFEDLKCELDMILKEIIRR